MALYWFRALDTQGHIRQAHMSFSKAHEARLYFAEQRWALLSLRRIWYEKSSMKKEVALFFLQAAYALDAGHSLSATLELLQKSHKGFFAMVLATLSYHLNQGELLSQAMKLFPWLFSPSLVILVKTGETSGRLASVFKQAHQFLSQDLTHRKALHKALAPMLLNFAFLGVALGVLVHVLLPELEILHQESKSLPATTRFLIHLKTHPLVSLVGLGGMTLSGVGLKWVFTHYLCFGILGVWRAKSHYFRFFSNLSILLEENIELTFAIKMASQSLSATYLQRAVKDLYMNLHRGKDFLVAIEDLPFLPHLYRHLLKAGQATGEILPSFKALLDLLEEDLKSSRNRMVFWLSPILLLCVALCFWVLMDGTILCFYQNIEALMD